MMRKLGGDGSYTAGWFDTHPGSAERTAALEKQAKQLMAPWADGASAASACLATKEKLPRSVNALTKMKEANRRGR